MPKPLQPLPDAISNSDSDSSEDGDFVPSGSGSGSGSDAPDSDISDSEVKKVNADAGDAVKLSAAAAGRRATRAAVAAATKRPASHAPPPATAVDDPAKKSRVDALFADLLADDPPLRPRGPVGGIITAAFASGGCSAVSAAAPFKASATAASASSSVAVPGVNGGALRPAALPSAMSGAGHKEVTVTSTKDFAGQLVTVTRTVAVGSEEHKKLMQKPKGTGLESVLGLLGKPKKASTMEKSASDWIGFVQKEGIADQLEENRKDGYMEKLCFLDRTAALQTQFIKQGKKAQAEAAAAADSKQQ